MKKLMIIFVCLMIFSDIAYPQIAQLDDATLKRAQRKIEEIRGILRGGLGYYNDTNKENLAKEIETYAALLNSSKASNQDKATAFKNTGIAYFKMQEYTKAIESLNNVLDQYKDVIDTNTSTECHRFIGMSYTALKEYDKAVEELKKGMENKDASLELIQECHKEIAIAYLCRLRLTDFTKEMENIIQKYQGIDPNQMAENHIFLAYGYLLQIKIDKSLETVEAIHQKYPEASRIYQLSADMFRSTVTAGIMKDYEKGVTLYKGILETYGDFIPPNWISIFKNAMAKCYFNMGKYEDARKIFEEVAKKTDVEFDTTAEGLVFEGKCYDALGNFTLAIKTYASAIEEYPMADYAILKDVPELISRSATKGNLWNIAMKELKSCYTSAQSHELLLDIVNTIAYGFKTMDMNTIRANKFLLYQIYGPEGKDGKTGQKEAKDQIITLSDRWYSIGSPLVKGSLIIKDTEGNTYKEGLDFEVNYTSGLIRTIPGGAIKPDTKVSAAFKTDYTLDDIEDPLKDY